MEQLPMRIKRLREDRQLSQKQVADAVGISRVAVTKWESGQTGNLKLANLTKLCEIFRVSYDYLINGATSAYTQDQTPETKATPPACHENSNNITPLPAAHHHSEVVRELASILDLMDEQGQWELIGHARLLAKIHPKAKANHAS